MRVVGAFRSIHGGWRHTVMDALGLQRTACRVWDEFLGLSAVPASSHAGFGGVVVTSVLRFDGARTGLLALTMTPAHACQLAATVFLMEADDVGERDIQDLLGELTQIMAQNLTTSWGGVYRYEAPELRPDNPPDAALGMTMTASIRSLLQSGDSSVLIRLSWDD
jgi:hypothetical protein